jgi:hypothetical protein
MLRILVSIILLLTICLPVLSEEKDINTIVVYEEFHIPIKFAETIDLSESKDGDKVSIAINENTGIDERKIFKENSEGYGVLLFKDGEWFMKSGQLSDIYGNKYPVKITSFCMEDFEKNGAYIIPEGFVIDAFTTEKKVLKLKK